MTNRIETSIDNAFSEGNKFYLDGLKVVVENVADLTTEECNYLGVFFTKCWEMKKSEDEQANKKKEVSEKLAKAINEH